MPIPAPVLSIYDQPMWQSIGAGRMALQRCDGCGRFRYPPGPICPDCLSLDSTWAPISGRGSILSWVIFHRQYFDAYPPPYNAIAVRLDEGPIMMSNLAGVTPDDSWIGHPVELCYEAVTGAPPRFRLATPS